MLKWVLIRCLYLTIIAANAQEITLKGVVNDTLGQPLELANVIAIQSVTKAMEGFSITNTKGQYKIVLRANTSYILKVSYLGLKTVKEEVVTSNTDITKHIILEAHSENLDTVELVYEMPVTFKGDTIVYNTDAFVSGTEKKLGDVLKKLPGLEVNDEGEIEAEGKKVAKVMVEGKDFFDGDSKLAVKNIPADAIDKIELLRNYNEVSQLSQVTNNQDNVALNILLKEGKKNFWFGEVSAGIGLEERYLVHPKLFYYNPKFSINILTDLNNVGEIPFTIKDYLNFTGGLKSLTEKGGTFFNPSSNNLGITLLQNNKAKAIDTKFGAVNFSYSPTNHWEISGFSIYSYANTQLETESNKSYTATSFQENTNSQTEQNTSLGLIKLSHNFKPNKNFQLDVDTFLKLSNQEENNVLETRSNVTDTITELKTQKPISLKNNLNAYYTHNSKNIFALELQHLYENEDPFYKAIRNIQPFPGVIPSNTEQSNYNINQDRIVTTNKIDSRLDYYFITGPKSNVNFTLGTTFSHQSFNSEIFQILDNQTELNFDDPQLNNDVTYNFLDTFIGFHYKFLTGKFTFTPGITLHQYTTENTQLGTTISNQLVNWSPDVFVNLQLKQSESIRMKYSISREFTDINKLASGYVLTDYNSIYQGDRYLESALYHNVSVNYFSFNMFNFQNIFANVTYNKRIDAFKGNNTIVGINQINSTTNSNFEDDIYSGSVNFQRTFRRIKASFSARVSYSKLNNIVNDTPLLSKSIAQNYKTSVATSFKKAPNVELGYHYIVNNYDNGGQISTFYTNTPFLKLEAAFWNRFLFTADFEYYKYNDKAKTIVNEYNFLDTSLVYQKPNSKWEYSAEVTNLLNAKYINQDSFNELYLTTSSYSVQPRYVFFKIKYNL